MLTDYPGSQLGPIGDSRMILSYFWMPRPSHTAELGIKLTWEWTTPERAFPYLSKSVREQNQNLRFPSGHPTRSDRPL